jgi:hypothetical protein
MPNQAEAGLHDKSIVERTRVPLVPVAGGLADFLVKMQHLLLATSPNWLAVVLQAVMPETRNVTGFKMERQCYSQWCWAAVAKSIGKLSAIDRKQCDIATVVLNEPCCGHECDVIGLHFDVPAKLSKALKSVGHDLSDDEILDFEKVNNPKPDLSVIQEHIRKHDAPVCVRIELENNPGHFHFVVISGFEPGDRVVIKDPLDGENPNKLSIGYNEFPEHYDRVPGHWRTTYFTKRT